MSELHMMVTITDRSQTKRFTNFYSELGLDISFLTVGNGTAASEILDYFGLDGSEKSVLFHIVTTEKWKEVKRQLQIKMKGEEGDEGIGKAILDQKQTGAVLPNG